jgi:hypothetical protein
MIIPGIVSGDDKLLSLLKSLQLHLKYWAFFWLSLNLPPLNFYSLFFHQPSSTIWELILMSFLCICVSPLNIQSFNYAFVSCLQCMFFYQLSSSIFIICFLSNKSFFCFYCLERF